MWTCAGSFHVKVCRKREFCEKHTGSNIFSWNACHEAWYCNAMKPAFCLLIPACILVLCPAAVAQDAALASQLARAYGAWRAAMQSGDAKAWAAAITMHRQVTTRNLIVSQRKNWPAAVFEVPLDPPDISSLRLLEADAVGETAHLLFFGRVDMGGGPGVIPESVLMLKFFNERGTWKFDSSKLLRLDDQPEIAQQIKAGGRLDFLDYPEFTPPGKSPPVPKICGIPDHVTGCTFQSLGYQTRMIINGHDYPVMTDHAEKIFVIGGLKNGANEIILEVKPVEIPPEGIRLLQLDFFVLAGKEGRQPVRVFHYEKNDPNLTGTQRLTLTITPEILSKGL
ncbi:MAG TPA: hypothetical protein DIT64_12210 [Verrucomicrobiales bacterium]|nr:hypothetical protein [Verrucomicrobiales bacterium]